VALEFPFPLPGPYSEVEILPIYLPAYLPTYLVTGSGVLLEKLTVPQSRNSRAFYWTWRSTTVFTTAHHETLSWGRWIQSTLLHIISWESVLILSFLSMPRSTKWSLPFGFPTNILYASLTIPMRATCRRHRLDPYVRVLTHFSVNILNLSRSNLKR